MLSAAHVALLQRHNYARENDDEDHVWGLSAFRANDGVIMMMRHDIGAGRVVTTFVTHEVQVPPTEPRPLTFDRLMALLDEGVPSDITEELEVETRGYDGTVPFLSYILAVQGLAFAHLVRDWPARAAARAAEAAAAQAPEP